VEPGWFDNRSAEHRRRSPKVMTQQRDSPAGSKQAGCRPSTELPVGISAPRALQKVPFFDGETYHVLRDTGATDAGHALGNDIGKLSSQITPGSHAQLSESAVSR
jgi:hypothetical protein